MRYSLTPDVCLQRIRTAGRMGWCLALSLFVLVSTVATTSRHGPKDTHLGKRLATVEDGIRMTRLANSVYLEGGSSRGRVALFSPNGRQFVVVLMRGDLRRNTTDYSLYVFRTASVFSSSPVRPELTMRSSTNRPALRDVKWLGDNQTVAFLGERPGELPQVYTFNTKTRVLRRLTDHPAPIVSYVITKDGKTVLYYAEPRPENVLTAKGENRWGVDITTQTLPQLLGGACYRFIPTVLQGEQLFLKREGEPAKRIKTTNLLLDIRPPSLSPDGRYALVMVFVRHVPPLWKGYLDRIIRSRVVAKRVPGSASGLTQYMLLNIHSGRLSPLFNAPTLSRAEGFAWSPNGQSVVISGTVLPLDSTSPGELATRAKSHYVVDVTLPDRRLTVITTGELKVAQWIKATNTIVLEPTILSPSSAWEAYKKGHWGWKAVPLKAAHMTTATPIEVTLDQDMNTPPRIFVSDPKDGRRRILLDLNPKFRDLDLARVEAISWRATDGHVAIGGLYLPPGYIPGKKYPLVIQTHGFSPSRFWFDGPWNSAFAAQPLAAHGIMVLQVGGSKNPRGGARYVDTTEEGPRQMADYEGAVRFLTQQGMIDPKEVGIIGFSRTVYSVEYTLTHSSYRFRAATVADGIDAGYFSYMVFPNAEYELLNGGAPFGRTLRLWLKNSPSFNLDKVRTPVRIEAYSAFTLLGAWEWFAGLTRLRKPVDFIYLPHATHMLMRPWDRMASEQGDVDWFCFWLKGAAPSGPAKREEYARWRRLAGLLKQEDHRH